MKTTNFFIALLTVSLISLNAQAFTTTGFSNPFGVTVDTKTGFIYVSNVNGDPKKRDDNGFISRLKGDGTVDRMRFIDGASDKIVLSAPKGMAIAEERLYVTDIDKLHAFDLKTGKFLFDVNFGGLPIQHFYDVVPGPDGSLYLVDGPANTVYRIDIERQHEVTSFISGDELGQPHSIVWFPARQVFAVAGWSSGQVAAFDRAGKRQTYPAILLRTLEGIAADRSGNMYVASSGLSSIYRIGANFALHTFSPAFKSPAGVAFNPGGDEVIAASIEDGKVESISVAKEGRRTQAPVIDVSPPPKPKIEARQPAEEEKAEPEKGEKKAEEKPKKAEEKPAEKPTGKEKPSENSKP